MDRQEWIDRNRKYSVIDSASGFALNLAGMKFTPAQLDALKPKFAAAHQEMVKLEAGAVKNPDEKRQVTHFTDRAAYPSDPVFAEVEAFAAALRSGELKGGTGKKFEQLVVNGIGGSALGPQLMQFALNGPYWNELTEAKRQGWLRIYFVDNTDPAGVKDALAALDLEKTLVLSVSKSGGTQETKNNTIAFAHAFAAAKLSFVRHAAAITMAGSELDRQARSEGWLKVIPMAESIGGRTSETSVVGHLPAALAGVDFRSFIAGACHMDQLTRVPEILANPAYALAATWHIAGNGKGDRNMVIVPYSDRLVLLSRYMQQLVMESLGKEKDLDGKTVHQGLNVFGNKGGTDAHAFIQQLNDGRDDFFVTFIESLQDAMEIPIPGGVTMGDYLHGFETGLSNALLARGRQVIQIQIAKVDAFNLGMLIALYERAVAVYAELVHINAFNQPGVQAYKLASKGVIELTLAVQAAVGKLAGWKGSAADFAAKAGLDASQLVEIEGLLARLAANSDTRPIGAVKPKRRFDAQAASWIYEF